MCAVRIHRRPAALDNVHGWVVRRRLAVKSRVGIRTSNQMAHDAPEGGLGVSSCSTHQLRIELDLGSRERLGYRAVLLGPFGVLEKSLLIDAGYIGGRFQLDQRYREATFYLSQVNLRGSLDAPGRNARLRQACRERHREASRVGGADQLFGIGSLAFFEPG